MTTKNLGKVVPQKGVDYFTDEDIKSLNIPKNTSDLNNDSEYATENYVKNQIANAQLEGGEVDLSGYATKDDLDGKVDKKTGKSLISDTEIERLASVTNYDDTAIKDTLNNKANSSDIPTKISQLTNDSNYATTSYVDSAIASGGSSSSGSGLTTNERNTLIEVINAIGVFNVTNGQELINNFNNAWGGIITEIPATGITLNKSSLEFTSNVSQTLVAIVTPTDTTDKVTWVSNNNGIATVTNGIVYPISNGSCTITASVGNYSAICDVTVNVENTGGEETTGIKQYGSTLIINSGVAVTQDGSTLSLT